MVNIIVKSYNYKKISAKLIKEKKLVSSLSKFGDVVFCGAYKYNLMLNGDIDVYVVRKKKYQFKEVLKFFNILVLEGKFRSYFIKGDWDDVRIGSTFPNGHYIGFKEHINKEVWKVDVWFVDEKELKRLQKFEPQNVSKSDRKLILEIKQYRNKKDLRLSGLEIYQNVQNKIWTSVGDFVSKYDN